MRNKQKQTKSKGKKHVKTIKVLTEEELQSVDAHFPKNIRIDETKNEIDEIRKWKDKIKRKNSNYEASKYPYLFQRYETIRCFGESIYSGKISILGADMDQTNLLKNMKKCKSRPKTKED